MIEIEAQISINIFPKSDFMAIDTAVLRSALSAQIGANVISREEYVNFEERKSFGAAGALKLDEIFSFSHVARFANAPPSLMHVRPVSVLSLSYDKIEDTDLPEEEHMQSGRRLSPNHQSDRNIHIFATMLDGTMHILNVSQTDTIKSLKQTIEAETGLSADSQRLMYNGAMLRNEQTLLERNIFSHCRIYVLQTLPDGRCCTYYLDESQFDPKFDFDFCKITTDKKRYTRGGYEYQRPIGYYRFGVSVLGKYGNDNWLGPQGSRTWTEGDEWPVSYHGSATVDGRTMADDGVVIAKGQRPLYGFGVHSVPSVEIASVYSTKFQHDGMPYEMIFQNRVNPKSLMVLHNDKQLLNRKSSSELCRIHFVSPKGTDLRPYGICIKPRVKSSAITTNNRPV